MLDLHQRAAFLPTEPPLTWLHFICERFLGEMRERWRTSTVSLTFHSAVQKGDTLVELRGQLEFSANGALPVVFDCAGTLDLATRELAFEDTKAWSYTGRFAENGRVISLERRSAEGARSKPFHLIEASTLRELL